MLWNVQKYEVFNENWRYISLMQQMLASNFKKVGDNTWDWLLNYNER